MGKLGEEHGKYPKHTREDLTSYSWCFSNGIKIGPIPLWGKDWGNWTVEITINGKTNRSPHVYIKDMIWEKIYEYYRYYYEKYFRDSK